MNVQRNDSSVSFLDLISNINQSVHWWFSRDLVVFLDTPITHSCSAVSHSKFDFRVWWRIWLDYTCKPTYTSIYQHIPTYTNIYSQLIPQQQMCGESDLVGNLTALYVKTNLHFFIIQATSLQATYGQTPEKFSNFWGSEITCCLKIVLIMLFSSVFWSNLLKSMVF